MLEILVHQTLEQHRERLREVEKQIIIREALAHRSGGPKGYYYAVEHVGAWLVAWGRHLQMRSERRRSHYV